MEPIRRPEGRPPSVFDLRVVFVPDDPSMFVRLGDVQTSHVVDGVLAMLVADVDGQAIPLTRGLVETAGWDPWEAWSSARGLTEILEGADERQVLDVDGAEIVALQSGRPYLPTLMTALDSVVPTIGERGALVSAPSRHSLLVHPLHDETGRIALEALVPLSRAVHDSDGAPLSPHVYWWRNGALSCIPTVWGREGIDAYLSDELASLLDAA